MTWLITGGAGYIGAHVVRAAMSAGMSVVVVDNFSTGHASRVPANVPILNANIGDITVLDFLQEHHVKGIVHLAAMKSVNESQSRPFEYWKSNVSQMIQLLEYAQKVHVKNFVFSSSAAVYGQPNVELIKETERLQPINNYGRTKVAGELLLDSISQTLEMSCISLRYFNVAGAASAELKDLQTQNLIPIILEKLRAGSPVEVFGKTHATRDGTCIRDYVHVLDIADAHLAAMQKTLQMHGEHERFNLGSGQGTSVLEVIKAISDAISKPVPYQIRDARSADPAFLVADVSEAAKYLGWRAVRSLSDIATSSI